MQQREIERLHLEDFIVEESQNCITHPLSEIRLTQMWIICNKGSLEWNVINSYILLEQETDSRKTPIFIFVQEYYIQIYSVKL